MKLYLLIVELMDYPSSFRLHEEAKEKIKTLQATEFASLDVPNLFD